MTIKYYIALFVLLTGCSTTADTPIKDKVDNTAHKKIFELDLTDQGISSEGGSIKLFKKKSIATLNLAYMVNLDNSNTIFSLKKTI